MNPMKTKELGMLILLSIIWGGSFFFVKIALQSFPPFTIVFLRVTIAAIILLGVVYLGGQRMPAFWKQWKSFLIMGALNNAIPFSLIVWGQTQIESGVASILNATTPIFTIIFAHFLTSDERITFRKLMGVLLGFAGVYFLLMPNLHSGFSLRGLGQIAVLGAAVSYSFAGIFGKKFKNTSPVISSAGMLICSSVMMLPPAIFVDSPWMLAPSLNSILAIFGIAVLSTAAAYILYFKILASAGATNVLLVTFLIPVSALCLGVGILGEVLGGWEYAGLIFIFAGLLITDGRIFKQAKNIFRKETQVENNYEI